MKKLQIILVIGLILVCSAVTLYAQEVSDENKRTFLKSSKIDYSVLYEARSFEDQFDRTAYLEEVKSRSAGYQAFATISMDEIAKYYYNKGNMELAESLFLRILEIRERILGKEHAAVAPALGNLAVLYDVWEENKEAEKFYKQALETFEKSYGPENMELVPLLKNMVKFYRKMDYNEIADELDERIRVISSG